MRSPLPAPSLQGSAPGSAVEYPLSGLELHTNYTATVRGLRGPNLTAPASVTFTTGAAWSCAQQGRGGSKELGWASSSFSFPTFPSQG